MLRLRSSLIVEARSIAEMSLILAHLVRLGDSISDVKHTFGKNIAVTEHLPSYPCPHYKCHCPRSKVYYPNAPCL